MSGCGTYRALFCQFLLFKLKEGIRSSITLETFQKKSKNGPFFELLNFWSLFLAWKARTEKKELCMFRILTYSFNEAQKIKYIGWRTIQYLGLPNELFLIFVWRISVSNITVYGWNFHHSLSTIASTYSGNFMRFRCVWTKMDFERDGSKINCLFFLTKSGIFYFNFFLKRGEKSIVWS